MMLGIVGTSFWPVIRDYIKIEPYEREGGGVWNPRERIELWNDMPAEVRRQALAFEMPCVACGAPIHPIRQREKSGHLYYAATCPWTVNLSCSRGSAAREEYRRVSAAAPTRPPRQGSLL